MGMRFEKLKKLTLPPSSFDFKSISHGRRPGDKLHDTSHHLFIYTIFDIWIFNIELPNYIIYKKIINFLKINTLNGFWFDSDDWSFDSGDRTFDSDERFFDFFIKNICIYDKYFLHLYQTINH